MTAADGGHARAGANDRAHFGQVSQGLEILLIEFRAGGQVSGGRHDPVGLFQQADAGGVNIVLPGREHADMGPI